MIPATPTQGKGVLSGHCLDAVYGCLKGVPCVQTLSKLCLVSGHCLELAYCVWTVWTLVMSEQRLDSYIHPSFIALHRRLSFPHIRLHLGIQLYQRKPLPMHRPPL